MYARGICRECSHNTQKVQSIESNAKHQQPSKHFRKQEQRKTDGGGQAGLNQTKRNALVESFKSNCVL